MTALFGCTCCFVQAPEKWKIRRTGTAHTHPKYIAIGIAGVLGLVNDVFFIVRDFQVFRTSDDGRIEVTRVKRREGQQVIGALVPHSRLTPCNFHAFVVADTLVCAAT